MLSSQTSTTPVKPQHYPELNNDDKKLVAQFLNELTAVVNKPEYAKLDPTNNIASHNEIDKLIDKHIGKFIEASSNNFAKLTLFLITFERDIPADFLRSSAFKKTYTKIDAYAGELRPDEHLTLKIGQKVKPELLKLVKNCAELEKIMALWPDARVTYLLMPGFILSTSHTHQQFITTIQEFHYVLHAMGPVPYFGAELIRQVGFARILELIKKDGRENFEANLKLFNHYSDPHFKAYARDKLFTPKLFKKAPRMLSLKDNQAVRNALTSLAVKQIAELIAVKNGNGLFSAEIELGPTALIDKLSDFLHSLQEPWPGPSTLDKDATRHINSREFMLHEDILVTLDKEMFRYLFNHKNDVVNADKLLRFCLNLPPADRTPFFNSLDVKWLRQLYDAGKSDFKAAMDEAVKFLASLKDKDKIEELEISFLKNEKDRRQIPYVSYYERVAEKEQFNKLKM